MKAVYAAILALAFAGPASAGEVNPFEKVLKLPAGLRVTDVKIANVKLGEAATRIDYDYSNCDSESSGACPRKVESGKVPAIVVYVTYTMPRTGNLDDDNYGATKLYVEPSRASEKVLAKLNSGRTIRAGEAANYFRLAPRTISEAVRVPVNDPNAPSCNDFDSLPSCKDPVVLQDGIRTSVVYSVEAI